MEVALRNLSAKLGYFVHSEKGRQLYPLTKIMTGNILNYGYCVHPDTFKWEDHVESGPVWKWHTEHLEDNFARLGANFRGEGPGVLRKIPQESLDELKSIFDVTGGTERMNAVEKFSEEKAREMGMSIEEYFSYTFGHCSEGHLNEE